MKRFIRNFGSLIIIALISYVFIVYAVRQVLPNKYAFVANVPYVPAGAGHLQVRLADVKNFSNVDFLVIGSSHAYRGFDPRIFREYDYSMFNLGSSAQTPLQSNYLLRKYFKQLNPKKVIVEVFSEAFMKDGVESSTDLISNSPLDFEILKMSLSHANIKVVNTFLYAFIDQSLLENEYLQPKKSGSDTYISGGYVATDFDFQKEYEIVDSVVIDPKQLQLDALEQIVKFLHENDTPFILVQAPTNEELYKTFRNTTEFDNKMASYGRYINYNEMIELQNSAYYFDRDHLNQKGVKSFNKVLLNSISEESF